MTEYVTVTADMPQARDGAIKLHGPAGFEGMRRAGRLGADTDSIFHDLGYTDTEIAAMKDSGAIQ